MSATERRAACRDDVTLFLVVAAVNAPLLAEITDLGWTLTPGEAGYRPVLNSPLRLVVVDLSVAGVAERDELMRWFAGVVKSLSLENHRWLTQHTGGRGAMKATPDLEGWDDWMERYIAAMPPERLFAHFKPEERLAGLAPEERLAGLTPEERARALSEADHVLALPDAALRGLPADYLATLPEAAQARIRNRLGR